MEIWCLGSVSSGPCGVRDYGSRLAGQLGVAGHDVTELWFENDGSRFRSALRTAVGLLRACVRPRRGATAIWHYSVYAYSFRGIPLPGVLLGIVLRLRSVTVIAVLHEMALHWDVPRRQKVHCVLQRLALPLVLAGADEVVVTTERRQQWLISRLRVSRRKVHVLPVFSNFPPVSGEAFALGRLCGSETTAKTLVALSWASMAGAERLFLNALSRPELAVRDLAVELIGAPGPASGAAERWRSLALEEGQDERMWFSGVVSPDEFSSHLRHADVAILLFGDGPSTRHTLLAAALANGCATLAVDGPDTWEILRESDAVEIIPANSSSIAEALASLLDDYQRRHDLSTRALEVYDRYMSVQRAAEKILQLASRTARK